ncbi:MAG TPA: maleylpyruvate isomerase N-terminal domain-containing protein [Acidimicrobiales bacterium]|nr:maleylpyruvate isomerase N-terminal domain-containing protein [Acidimicrobiales bacterium]
MGAPAESIEGCRFSHAALLSSIEGLTDEEARSPCRLPGWTRGHVLTHLARNADSVVRHLGGAARGVVLNQYPGGMKGRAEAIEAGAARPAADLIADVRSSAARVERAFADLPERAWDNLVRSSRGVEYPASFVAFARWREVEVHHLDLGLGRAASDWPGPMVTRWLELELADLGDRAGPGALLAWIIGRGPAPEIGPW